MGLVVFARGGHGIKAQHHDAVPCGQDRDATLVEVKDLIHEIVGRAVDIGTAGQAFAKLRRETGGLKTVRFGQCAGQALGLGSQGFHDLGIAPRGLNRIAGLLERFGALWLGLIKAHGENAAVFQLVDLREGIRAQACCGFTEGAIGGDALAAFLGPVDGAEVHFGFLGQIFERGPSGEAVVDFLCAGFDGASRAGNGEGFFQHLTGLFERYVLRRQNRVHAEERRPKRSG